jgi:hypothetical protein
LPHFLQIIYIPNIAMSLSIADMIQKKTKKKLFAPAADTKAHG